MKNFFIFLFTFCVTYVSFGQCFTTSDTIPQNLTEFSPGTAQELGVIRVVPVVFHVLHNNKPVGVDENISDAQIMSALQELNNNYRNVYGTGADVEIEFCLAKFDPNGNPSTGIERISTPVTNEFDATSTPAEDIIFNEYAWNTNEYLNIWIVKELVHKYVSGGIQYINYDIIGRGTIPSENTPYVQYGTNRDGVVIEHVEIGTIGTASNTSNGWLAHEVGHWLDLYHIFKDVYCTSSFTGYYSGVDGDGVSDTPLIYGQDIFPYHDGKDPATFDCSASFATCTITVVPNNFMLSHTSAIGDKCFNNFTPGQGNRMRYGLLNYRPEAFYVKGQQQGLTKCGCNAVSASPAEQLVGVYNAGISVDNFHFDIPEPNLHVTNTSILHLNAYNNAKDTDGYSMVGDYDDCSDYPSGCGFSNPPGTVYETSLSGERLSVYNGGKIYFGDVSNSPINTAILNIECSSLLEIGNNGLVQINDGSKLIVRSGGTLFVKSGGQLKLLGNSNIFVEAGGYICVEAGANIILQDNGSSMNISPVANYGINPNLSLGSSPTCSNPISYSGTGAIYCSPDYYTYTNGIVLNGGNTTWATSKKIKGIVRLTNNATLTITNSNTVIQFANSDAAGIKTNITIEPGSKLIITNGAKLTSTTDCISMWQGIEVWGDRTKTQTEDNQGYLIMQNGAIIENASEAVTLSKYGEGWAYNGGVIRATNSIFKNNRRCAEFMSYHRPAGPDVNASYFVNCTFISDAVLNDPVYTDPSGRRYPTPHFVTLWDVKGVRFSGNTFICSGNFDADLRGAAIYSIDASYNILPLISGTTYDGNEFIGLTKGVYPSCVNCSALNNVSIKNSGFDNVYQGITGNISFNSIRDNSFDNIPAPNLGVDAWGIYMDGAKGFTIDGNTFNTGSSSNYGTIVKNSSASGGIISENTYNNFDFANQTELDNQELIISCNNYNNNTNAWKLNPLSVNSLFKDQGEGCNTSQLRAGNEFSGNSTDIVSHLTNTWKYVAWGNPSSTIPSYTGNVNRQICTGGTTFDPKTCIKTPPCTTPPCAVALEKDRQNERNPGVRLQMLNELIRYYSSNGEDQQVIRLLEKENTLEAKKLLVPIRIDKRDHIKARKELNEIPSDNEEDRNYKKYYEVLVEQLEQGKKLHEVTGSQENRIREVAVSGTEVAANALVFLEFVKGEIIVRVPEKSPGTSARTSSAIGASLTSTLNKPELSESVPNPFSESTRIIALIPAENKTAELIIYSLLGEKMRTFNLQPGKENTINIEKGVLAPGIYLYNLTVDGMLIDTKTMIRIE